MLLKVMKKSFSTEMTFDYLILKNQKLFFESVYELV